uniref:OB-fold protein n=1 Tax=Roseivirga sp. TaxID=1964215 RepID=UPI004047D49F
MKRKTLLIITIVVALIAAYVVYSNFLKTAPSMKNRETEFRLSANELYAQFDADEIAANAKFQNKILEISGEVVEVTSELEGNPSISLKTDGFGVIKCTLESALSFEALQNMAIGDELTIKGECIGMLLDVLIERSIIIQP